MSPAATPGDQNIALDQIFPVNTSLKGRKKLNLVLCVSGVLPNAPFIVTNLNGSSLIGCLIITRPS